MDTAYWMRPEGLSEGFGYYWPDGVPSELPSNQSVSVSTYQDENGEKFHIAYTDDQMRHSVEMGLGIWSPFIPVYVTPSILPSRET